MLHVLNTGGISLMLLPILMVFLNVESLVLTIHGRKFVCALYTRSCWSRLIDILHRPPVLEANENDTLVIHTHNGLDEPTALHAHGMFQNGTGWMDGPSMVTQW